MRQEECIYEGTIYLRCDRKRALRRYMNHEEVLVTGVNVAIRPHASSIYPVMKLKQPEDENLSADELKPRFYHRCAAYEFYNHDMICGYYLKYYIPIESLTKQERKRIHKAHSR